MGAGDRGSRRLRTTPVGDLLSHGEFRMLWGAVTVSQVGDWMQLTAQVWLVLELGGGAAAVTTVTAAGILPQLLFNLLGGIAADRVSKRTTMRVIALVQLAVSGLLAALVAAGLVNVPALILFSFLLGCLVALWQPVYLAFIPEIVPEDRLENAMGLSLTALYMARTVGPAVAGAVIALLGTQYAYLLNALTFVALVVALAAVRTPGLPPPDRPSPLATLGRGLRTVREDGVLLPLWYTACALSLLALPCLALVPVFARDVFAAGAAGLGVLMTGSGLGQLVGAVLLSAGVAGGVRRGGLLQVAGYVLMGLFLLGFALSAQLWAAFMALVGFNVLHGFLSPRVNAFVQRRAGDERGTAQALFLLVFGLVPGGQVLVGWLAGRFGPAPATAWFALAFLGVLVVVLVRARELRDYRA